MSIKYFVLLAFLTPQIAFAQSEYERAIVETETGGYIIFTSDSNSFVIHLDTAQLELMDSKDSFFLQVDKKWLLQLFTIEYQNPNGKDMNNLEVQKSSLLQYRNYEMGYFKDELKMNIKNPKVGWGPVGEKHFLLWHFETPDTPTVQKQIFLSTICFDSILNISIPLTEDQEFEVGLEFLDRVGRGLTLHDHSINIEEFHKQVNER